MDTLKTSFPQIPEDRWVKLAALKKLKPFLVGNEPLEVAKEVIVRQLRDDDLRTMVEQVRGETVTREQWARALNWKCVKHYIECVGECSSEVAAEVAVRLK